MNLEDLTEELSARAEAGARESGPGGQVARLTGVRHRIQVRRRRRAGVAVLATAAVALGIVWNPALPWTKSDRQVPAKVSQVDRVFAPARGDDPRIAAVIGRPGQTLVELRFTPGSGNLELAMACAHGAKSVDPAKPTTTIATSVNGHPFGGISCDGDELGSEGYISFDENDAARNSRIWRSELGVEPGKESIARITYTGDPAPDVQLGLGVYELSGARVKAGAKALAQTIGFAEKRYTLQRYASTQLSPGLTAEQRSVSLPGTASKGEVVCYGTTGKVDRGSTDQLFQDGQSSGGSMSGGYGCSQVENADSPAAFRMLAGKGSRGTAVIALYRAEDPTHQ